MILPLALLLQAAAPAAAPPQGPTTVETVTVTAVSRDPPAVASTWPAQGAAVAPGVTVLKVAFTTAMSRSGWRFAPIQGAARPRCLDRPRLLPDGKTFVLLCVTTEGAAWGVRLEGPASAGPAPAPASAPASTTGDAGEGGGPGYGPGYGPGFRSVGGKPLAAYDLRFSTTAERSVGSLEDAMKAAALADDQGPIMEDGLYGLAVAAPPPAVLAPTARAPARAPPRPPRRRRG